MSIEILENAVNQYKEIKNRLIQTNQCLFICAVENFHNLVKHFALDENTDDDNIHFKIQNLINEKIVIFSLTDPSVFFIKHSTDLVKINSRKQIEDILKLVESKPVSDIKYLI